MKTRGRPVGSYKRLFPARVNGKVTKLYTAYQSMIHRCTNPNAHNWKWYGGKGVTVCDRWTDKATGFESFAMDMGEPPAGLTLGRLDNTKPYGPDNCAWQTWKQQAANRGKVGPAINPSSLRQQAIRAGQPYHRVIQRLRAGWTLQDALQTPCVYLAPQTARM